MFEVSDAAGTELRKVLDSDHAKGKSLIVTFAGVG